MTQGSGRSSAWIDKLDLSRFDQATVQDMRRIGLGRWCIRRLLRPRAKGMRPNRIRGGGS